MANLVEHSSKILNKKSPKILEGQFAVMDSLNQNGRIYPSRIYESALEELTPKIQNRSLCGECDHPIDYDEIRLSNVSHVITDCRVVESEDGHKTVVGSVELLDTPAGKITQALVEAGVPLGISSRGVGDTRRISEGEEVTNLKLITFDLVAEPSFSSAVLSEKKVAGLEESLSSIEKSLPLNESLLREDSSRSMIQRIRESLLTNTTHTSETITKVSQKPSLDIRDMEIDSLKNLVESRGHLLERRTNSLNEMKIELKETKSKASRLEKKLKEEKSATLNISRNMTKLQDSYNSLVETTVPQDDYKKLKESEVELRKQLAVEKRGMSYSQVRNLLEGVSTDKEISNTLDSLGKIRKGITFDDQVRANLSESKATAYTSNSKVSTKLSSLVSKV